MRGQITLLRRCMKEKGIDYYLVPTADFHNSEYVADYFKCREWLSGFTGSNGTILVGQEEALLWTDGRYFVQADNQLYGSGIKLMKMGEPGVPKVKEYLAKHMLPGETIGFDGRVFSAEYVDDMYAYIGKNMQLKYDTDLCDIIWQDRPARSASKAYVIGTEYTGESYLNKLKRVRDFLEEQNCQYMFLSKMDDIMWLFNMRGDDVLYNPVVLSYALISKDDCYLFVQNEAVTEEFALYCKINDIVLEDYDEIHSFLENTFRESGDFNTTDSIEPNLYADLTQVNYSIYRLLKGKTNVVHGINPTTIFKAVKNPTEIENIKDYFIQDSVAVCKFLYWLDCHRAIVERSDSGSKYFKDKRNNILNEADAARYLDTLRSRIPGFKGLSFNTISAYEANAAMMHYEYGRDGGSLLKNEGFLLVDSGGQYIGATTDVTRTISLGPLTEEQRRDFTLVCKGMLNLMNTKFIKGCTGRNLDIVARGPMWKYGMDYKCGTGHGVGCFLNVHEGPHSIRWRYIKDDSETVFEPGMLITDEPGVYKENKYGIRTENTLLVVEGEKTDDGEFLGFEPLTYVPIDIRAIDVQYLSWEDVEQLKNYQNMVVEKVSPFLSEDEIEWIKTYTFD